MSTNTIHPATRAALSTLAVTAPKAPLKGRGHRRVEFPFALRGAAAAVFAAIPRNHRDEVAVDKRGTLIRVISPEAAKKAAKPLAALGLARPTRASVAARPARVPFLLSVIGSPECRFFPSAAAANEWAQSRGLAYSNTRGGVRV